MRPAFTLISAVFLLVLIATLLALSYSLSSQITKQTGDLYLQEQAQLLARSSTEYALMAISGHNNNVNCIQNIDLQYPAANPLFDINMTIYYIGNGFPSSCTNMLDNTIQTPESNGTVMIDTVVSCINPVTSERIRYHRRTIQKP